MLLPTRKSIPRALRMLCGAPAAQSRASCLTFSSASRVWRTLIGQLQRDCRFLSATTPRGLPTWYFFKIILFLFRWPSVLSSLSAMSPDTTSTPRVQHNYPQPVHGGVTVDLLVVPMPAPDASSVELTPP